MDEIRFDSAVEVRGSAKRTRGARLGEGMNISSNIEHLRHRETLEPRGIT